MIESVLKFVIQGTALTVGLLAATFLGAQRSQPETAANMDVAERFQALTPEKQEQLLNRAEHYSRRKDGEDKAEWEHMQRLHGAVGRNPELIRKLQRFHEWWSSLNTLDRQSIRPNGTFVSDWTEAVQLVYSANDDRSHQISFRMWSLGDRLEASQVVSFSESAYEAFLDQAIPSPLSQPIAEKVSLYDEGCDRTLFKTIWLFHELRRQQSPGGRLNLFGQTPGFVTNVKKAVIDYLIPSQYAEQMRTSPATSVLPLLKAAFDHYSDQFRQKYLAAEREDLLSLYEGLPPEDQLTMMKADGSESRDELKNLLIRQLNSEDRAVAELANDMFRLNGYFDEMRRAFNRGPRGGKGRGGARGGFGGGGGRGREDGNQPRSNGGYDDRRDDDRGRGPGDGRPEGPRRGPGGFDGRRPDSRDANDHR